MHCLDPHVEWVFWKRSSKLQGFTRHGRPTVTREMAKRGLLKVVKIATETLSRFKK